MLRGVIRTGYPLIIRFLVLSGEVAAAVTLVRIRGQWQPYSMLLYKPDVLYDMFCRVLNIAARLT